MMEGFSARSSFAGGRMLRGVPATPDVEMATTPMPGETAAAGSSSPAATYWPPPHARPVGANLSNLIGVRSRISPFAVTRNAPSAPMTRKSTPLLATSGVPLPRPRRPSSRHVPSARSRPPISETCWLLPSVQATSVSVPFEAETAKVWSCAPTEMGMVSPSAPSVEMLRAKTAPPRPIVFSRAASRAQATNAVPFDAAMLVRCVPAVLSVGSAVTATSVAAMRMRLTSLPSRSRRGTSRWRCRMRATAAPANAPRAAARASS